MRHARKPGPRTALAFALGSATIALVACNVIVGADSYSIGSDAGGASDASTAGDSAPPGDATGGDTGAGGDTGSPGDGGPSSDGGVADTGTTSGFDGSCGSGLPTGAAFQQLLTSCAVAVSCSPGGFFLNTSQCVTQDYFHSIASIGCLANVTDCASYAACAGNGRPSAAQCPSASTPPSCSGNKAINCGGGLYGTPSVNDCSILGGTCGVFATDAGTAADCKVVGTCGQATDPTTYYCKGNSLYACDNGVGYGQDCGDAATCIDNPTNGPSCYFAGPACGTQGYACNGNTIEFCTSNNLQLSFNCGNAGLTCTNNVDNAGTAGCIAQGCTVADFNNCTEACSGNTLLACVGGAQVPVDCSKIKGFSTCAMLSDSQGFPYAGCN